MRRNHEPEANPLKPVAADEVASKIEAISNREDPKEMLALMENPRLAEMLFFVQAMSRRPRALLRLAEEMLEKLPHRIGTVSMLASGGQLSGEEKRKIWSEIPDDYLPYDVPDYPRADYAHLDCEEAKAERREKFDREMQKYLRKFERQHFVEWCRKGALKELPVLLLDLCTNRENGLNIPAWFFGGNLQGALFELMDISVEEALKTVARTEVVEKIIETLDRTYETQSMTMLRGNSRFGKTEALKAACATRPGRMRLVTVPPSNSFREFLSAVAEALGVDISVRTDFLRRKIAKTIKQSGMFIIFDEGAFLVPQSFSKGSDPSRLNWVRTELFDKNLPVLVAVTPQWYDDPKTGALSKYVKATNFAIEQFTGRCQSVTLPEILEQADVLKVVRFHFPELTRECDLLDLAACAEISENYLQTIENLSKQTRYYMKRNGDAALTLKRVKEYNRELFQKVQALDEIAQKAPRNNNPKAPFKAPLRASLKPADRNEFQPSSLRGSVPEPRETELVSANS